MSKFSRRMTGLCLLLGRRRRNRTVHIAVANPAASTGVTTRPPISRGRSTLSKSGFTPGGSVAPIRNACSGSSRSDCRIRCGRKRDARPASAKANWRSASRPAASRLAPVAQIGHAGQRRHGAADDPLGGVRAAGSAACGRHRRLGLALFAVEGGGNSAPNMRKNPRLSRYRRLSPNRHRNYGCSKSMIVDRTIVIWRSRKNR